MELRTNCGGCVATIITANTVILREYYYVRAAADELHFLAKNFLSHFKDVVELASIARKRFSQCEE